MPLLTRTVHVPLILYRYLPALYILGAAALWISSEHVAARLFAVAAVALAAAVTMKRLHAATHRPRR